MLQNALSMASIQHNLRMAKPYHVLLYDPDLSGALLLFLYSDTLPYPTHCALINAAVIIICDHL